MKILKVIVVCLISFNLLGCNSSGLKPNEAVSAKIPSLPSLKTLNEPRKTRGGWFGINSDAKFMELRNLVTLDLCNHSASATKNYASSFCYEKRNSRLLYGSTICSPVTSSHNKNTLASLWQNIIDASCFKTIFCHTFSC